MSDFCRITRLRLVNFHNLGTTSIEIRDGGHLFLLGDNGSGKTTVLDAIHFVLTGGRSMEFNSAARFVGAKSAGGRSVQGIVMRYNIETGGPMNRDGGIAYAALEIETRGGRPLSIGVGVSARSLDDAYESWGFTNAGPVDDLPLLHEEGGRARPATRAELREALPPGNFFGRIGAYIDNIANRFFGGRATYADVCHLLGTGKAYREIAARAGDYDKLFRSLLQEPPREVFEELIRSLKSLEESKLALAALGERCEFLREIGAWRDRVRELRIGAACAQWQDHNLAGTECRESIGRTGELLEAEKRRLAELGLERERLENEEERAQNRLNELKQQDATGLVSREKEARLARAQARTAHGQARTRLVAAKRAAAEAGVDLEKCVAAIVKQMASHATELQHLGRSLPFATSGLSSSLDAATRAERPELEIADLPFAELHRAADDHAGRLQSACDAAERRIESLTAEICVQEGLIKAGRDREEAQPAVPCFDEARQAIRGAMLGARPLYEGLVPASGMRPREIAILEQIIGDGILATWITEAGEADSLRRLLFRGFPDHSLAVPEAGDDERCDWLGRFFDLGESDPDAIIVLGRQLVAKAGPHVQNFLDQRIVAFRGRETPATQSAPRLIGLEARREQLRREIREREKKRDDLAREHKAEAQKLQKLQDERQTVVALRALLQTAPQALHKTVAGVTSARQKLALGLRDEAGALDAVQRCEEDEMRATETHEDILLKLKQEGIEGLEQRIGEAEKKLRALRGHYGDCLREIGRTEDGVSRNKGEITRLSGTMAAALSARDAAEALLLGLVTIDGPLDTFVSDRCGEHVGSHEELRHLAEVSRVDAARHEESIRNALSRNVNQAFGFIYDQPGNKLTDRRGSGIDDVMTETEREFADQSSIITDETRRLFKQIVMDELIGALQKSVMRLRDMERNIAGKLRKRTFGNNRYAFTISPAEGYGAIIDLVRDYRSLDPGETEAELEEFFKRHFDEILATEVGEIPAMLDYRNWFRYELKILTADSGGQIIDRRVKGLGSGGEQAVPNYLLILMIANFLYDREKIRLPALIFDEAFYGIDAARRDQILAFATDLDLQLLVASPDQDGVKKEIPLSTSVLVVKDADFDVHLYAVHWNRNPRQQDLLDPDANVRKSLAFERETT